MSERENRDAPIQDPRSPPRRPTADHRQHQPYGRRQPPHPGADELPPPQYPPSIENGRGEPGGAGGGALSED